MFEGIPFQTLDTLVVALENVDFIGEIPEVPDRYCFVCATSSHSHVGRRAKCKRIDCILVLSTSRGYGALGIRGLSCVKDLKSEIIRDSPNQTVMDRVILYIIDHSGVMGVRSLGLQQRVCLRCLCDIP